MPTCDRCEKRGTAEDFFFRVFLNLFAVSDTVLLHMWFHLRRRNILVLRNSLVRRLRTAPTQDKLYQTSKFADAVRYNVPRICAARVCRALR